jgi:crossover junction endodeoxyribonuclease RuvC
MSADLLFGCDPGLIGALALLNPDGSLFAVEDLPVMARSKKGRVKNEIDAAGLARLIRPHAARIKLAVVEQVGSMPGQGVASVFSMGHTLGCIVGVLQALQIPLHLVPPAVWKRKSCIAVESINSKDFSRLKPYADDCNATDDHTVACGMSVLYGFTRVLVQSMEVAFDDGRLKFSNGGLPYRATEVSYAFMTGRGRFISLYHGATKTMARVLKAAPSFKISLASKSEAAAPAPIPVQIVGMPTRATTTDIERNGAGEIISSLQVEKDF